MLAVARAGAGAGRSTRRAPQRGSSGSGAAPRVGSALAVAGEHDRGATRAAAAQGRRRAWTPGATRRSRDGRLPARDAAARSHDVEVLACAARSFVPRGPEIVTCSRNARPGRSVRRKRAVELGVDARRAADEPACLARGSACCGGAHASACQRPSAPLVTSFAALPAAVERPRVGLHADTHAPAAVTPFTPPLARTRGPRACRSGRDQGQRRPAVALPPPAPPDARAPRGAVPPAAGRRRPGA